MVRYLANGDFVALVVACEIAEDPCSASDDIHVR